MVAKTAKIIGLLLLLPSLCWATQICLNWTGACCDGNGTPITPDHYEICTGMTTGQYTGCLNVGTTVQNTISVCPVENTYIIVRGMDSGNVEVCRSWELCLFGPVACAASPPEVPMRFE